jgi:hypothetical protein
MRNMQKLRKSDRAIISAFPAFSAMARGGSRFASSFLADLAQGPI